MKRDTQKLLAEIRNVCHVLWETNDPKALEAWHILFDAHNEYILSMNHNHPDVEALMGPIETKHLKSKYL